MAAAHIGKEILVDAIGYQGQYLRIFLNQWQQIRAAPEQIRDISPQVYGLCICVESLFANVVADDSVVGESRFEGGEMH